MSLPDFSVAADRSGSLSVKWNRDAIKSICNNPDAIPYWVADMDFPAPIAVTEALREQAAHGVLGYPYGSSVVETFTDWALRRHRWKVDPTMVVTAPGMLAAISILVELYSGEGDGILLPMPAYRPFVHIIRSLGRKVVQWPMSYDAERNRFGLDVQSLQALLSGSHIPILLFCSPHNPSGRVFSDQELTEVASLSSRFGTMVISDEIHADLTYEENGHTPFNEIARKFDLQSATCMAPSKTFNIAGEHCSVVVCSDATVRNRLAMRMRALHLAPDLLASVTASAAYRHGETWLGQLRNHLCSQAHAITSQLAQSGTPLRFVTPQASFIGLIDCTAIMEKVTSDAERNAALYDPSSSGDGGLLSRFFGQRGNIAVNDGSWFGADYGHFVRFNFGTSARAVQEGITAMINAVRNLR